MPWAKSFCPLPFRYAPVTVGSGRAAYRSFWAFSPYLNHMRNFNKEFTLKSLFYKNQLLIINKLQRQK